MLVRFRRNMSTIDEDQIQLVEGSDSDSALEEEVHHIPSRMKTIRNKFSNSFTPTKRLISWWITTVVLGIISFLIVVIPLVLEEAERQECVDFENVRGYPDYEQFPFLFEEGNGKFVLCRRGEPVLEGLLGTNHTPLLEERVDVYTHSSNTVLNITRISPQNCLRIEWTGLSSRESPIEDCYQLGDVHWYGMYEVFDQRWPINGAEFNSTPFLPNDYLSSEGVFGPVLHPLWLSSEGAGIHIDNGVQLYYKINSTAFCFRAEPYELECVPKASDVIFLNYTVCEFDSITQAAKFFLNESGLISHPVSTPHLELFSKPIWSTWAETKSNLTDDILQKFHQNIVDNGFDISQLEIDDGYSEHYGDLAFNKNISTAVLRDLSTNVPLTAWVHPFINHNSDGFHFSLESDHFLPGFYKDESNSVSLVRWWQGYGGVINFLRQNTSEWRSQGLANFLSSNYLTALKFDGGEYTYMPQCVYIHGLDNNPSVYTRAYVGFVANQTYSDRSEVRVGYFTQEHAVLVRLLDRESSWGVDNGLRSVLNAVLSLGMAGYGFILPDMIGGNGVVADDLHNTEIPDIELYIRWLQLNTFLPFMQFSLGPWRYDNTTLMDHVREMMALHTALSEEYFVRLSEDVISSGYPIIRPLWWINNGSEARSSSIWTADDLFLIGDELLVAPVMEQGATSKSVYFPLGSQWTVVRPEAARDTCANAVCGDGKTVVFEVTLWEVLYFSRLNKQT